MRSIEEAEMKATNATLKFNWWKWALLGVISIAIATAMPGTSDERVWVLILGTVLYLAGSFVFAISAESVTVEIQKETTKD